MYPYIIDSIYIYTHAKNKANKKYQALNIKTIMSDRKILIKT